MANDKQHSSTVSVPSDATTLRRAGDGERTVTEGRKEEYVDLGLERLCECGYPRRMHGNPLTASCDNYKAASYISDPKEK